MKKGYGWIEEGCRTDDVLGGDEMRRHTFCFLVLHPLQAPLIRDGMMSERDCCEKPEALG